MRQVFSTNELSSQRCACKVDSDWIESRPQIFWSNCLQNQRLDLNLFELSFFQIKSNRFDKNQENKILNKKERSNYFQIVQVEFDER